MLHVAADPLEGCGINHCAHEAVELPGVTCLQPLQRGNYALLDLGRKQGDEGREGMRGEGMN